MFAPYVTDDHQRRYHHLRSAWDEETGEWVQAEKRYLFVTVCRQVAGEWVWALGHNEDKGADGCD